MSTEIEQRVVEMRFDNKHFESNVSTTMSTLDKLKQKLHLDGATKGLENVDNAARKVNMSGLAAGVEAVSMKFSALQVMGITALTNITNSAVNAGKRIVSALTIDPVRTGLSEYETKINAIQVIQANTRAKYTKEEIEDGTQMRDITEALEELNDYADKTIYNYAQMTSNVGKFVAQGLSAREASKAVQGLANLAAASGASAEDMSRATYQMSQALGGTIRLIDWNSLRNANMATVDLKNTLMDLARANDIAIDDMIEKHGAFEQTLSEGWLTGKMFSEAMNIYSGVYSEAELKAKGFTETQIENFMQLAKNAESAATEVKTFTQLWDVLKETAQSGWTQTWELIIGDFDSAKKTLSQVQAYFSTIIDGFSDARNFIIGGVMNIAKPWTEIIDKLSGSGLGKIKSTADAVGDLSDKLEYFQDIVTKVWRGDYDNGHIRRELLAKAGYDARVVQDLVNKGSEYKITVEDIKKSHEKFGLTLETSAEETEKVAVALGDLNDEQLKNAGLTEDEIELYRALEKEASRTGITISELVDKMTNRSGRTLLIESIKNAWKGLVKIVEIAKDAFVEVFNPPNSGEIIIKLYSIIEAVHEFSEKLTLVDKETGGLTETAKKFQRIFEGVFALFYAVTTILSGPLKFAFKVVVSILEQFGVGVLDVLAGIGDAAVKFNNTIDKTIGALTKFIVDNVGEWIKAFKETEFFKTIAGWFQDASAAISNAVDTISDKLSNINASKFMETIRSVYGVITELVKSITDSELFQAIADGIANAFTKLKEAMSNLKLPEINLDKLKNFSTNLVKIGEKIPEGANGVLGAVTGFFTHLKDNVISWNWTVFKETALEKFTNFMLKSADKIKAAFEKGKEIAYAIKKFIFGSEEVNLPSILGVVERFLGIMVLIKTLSVMDAVVEPFGNITDALNNFAASIKWKAISGAFKSLALALAALTVCVLIISRIPDQKAAWSAAGMLLALMVVMGAVVTVMGLIASKTETGLNMASTAGSLLMMIGALVLLVIAIKQIDELNLKNPGKTFLTLAAVLLSMSLGIKMVAKAAGTSFRSVAAILTLMAALKMMLDIIDAYDQYDWSGKGDAIIKAFGMLAGIAVAINLSSRGLKAGSSASGMAAMILAMVISLKLMVGVIEDFGKMETASLVKGVLAISYLLLMLTGVAFVLGKANDGKVLEKGQKNVNNFTGLAIALLAVVGAIWLLSKMANNDLKGTLTGLGMVVVILGTLGTMFWAIGKAWQGVKAGPIWAMITMIVILAAAMTASILILKDVPWQNAAAYMGGLAVVVLAMGASLKMMASYDYNVGKLWNMLGAMAVLGLIVAGLSIVIRQMNGIPWETALAGAGALSILLVAMTGVLFALSKMTVTSNIMAPIGALGLLGLVVLELGWILSVINGMDMGDAMPAVKALSTLIIALTVVLAALTGLSLVLSSGGSFIASGGLVVAIAGLAALGLVVWELGGILNAMKTFNLGEAGPMVEVLSKLMFAMTGVLAALTVLGLFGVSSLVGVAAIAALGLVVWELGAILNAMKTYDIGNAGPMIEVLSVMLNSMVDALIPLTVIGVFAGAAIAGILVLTTMITVLGGLILLIGAMASKWEGVETAIDKGIEILNKIATGLGSAIGSFVDSLLGSIGDGLVSLANNLSKFMTALLPFTILVRTIGPGVVSGAGNLSKAIVALLAADFINKIASKLPGGFSLTSLAEDLSGFAEKISGFIDAMADIDTDAAAGVGALVDAITTLTKASFWDGIGDKILGNDSLTSFGTSIKEFATCIKDSAAVLKDITDEDVANIQRSADAGMALAKLNEAIPRKDGWLQDLIGKKDLEDFGVSANAFADCLVSYSDKVTGKKIDTDAIKKSAEAAQSLSDLANSIPSSGGTWQEWVGDKSLADFGKTLVDFGDCLVKYNEKVTGNDFSTEAIEKSAAAGAKLADVAGAIPSAEGVWQEWAGEKNLGTFGSTLTTFGQGLVDYCKAIAELPEDAKTKVESSKAVITAINGVIAEIPTSGGWWDAISGSKDGQSFGAALSSLAAGITDYCTVAATLGDEATVATIQNSKTAVTELGAVLTAIPETDMCTRAANMLLATESVESIAMILSAITVANYDYSGLTALRLQLFNVIHFLTYIDVETAKKNASDLQQAITYVKKCADVLSALEAITYTGLTEFMEAIDTLTSANVQGVIDAFSVDGESIANSIRTFINGMAVAISTSSGKVTTAMTKLVGEVVDAAKDYTDDFESAGKNFVSALVAGIDANAGDATTAGSSLGNNASTGARANFIGMFGAGQFLGAGLVAGIASKWQAAYNAGYSIGQAAVQGEKDGQESQSPSKATIRAGKWLGEGLVIGIGKMVGKVYTAGSELGGAASGSISSAVSKVADMVSYGIDAQPTIRPVLDLSDVEAGVGAIGGMFGSPMGTLNMAGRINASMNSRSQNGGNSDVVTAIDRLNKKMDNLGNTYQINGVTYDDGSNVSNAVKTIVRAARIERRVK